MISVTIPIRTVSEANARGHWTARAGRTKRHRTATALTLRSRVVGRLRPPCVVSLTRIAPRSLDDDNLRGALKAVRDEVAVWLGLPTNRRGQADDSDPRVRWEYAQERGAPRQYAVRVEIRAMAGEAA